MPQPNRKQREGKLKGKGKRKGRAFKYGKAGAPRKYEQRKTVRKRRKAEGFGGGQSKPVRPPAAGVGPAAPTQPKYGPLMQRAQRDADLTYGQDILRAQAQQQNAGTYFEQYKADVAKAQQAVTDRYAQAQQQVQGPTVGPAVAGADEAQAAASRAVMDKAFQNLLTSQGAAQADYFQGRGTVGSAQQLQSRTQAGDEVNRLSSERDRYALNRRDELRDERFARRGERHTRKLERKAFGLDVAEAAADAQSDAADRKQQRREAKRERKQERREDRQERREKAGEVNQYGYTKREWDRKSPAERRAAIREFKQETALPDKPEKKGQKYTPEQQHNARKDIRKAAALVRSKVTDAPGYYEQARDALIGEKDMDPVIAKAAVQLIRDGKVNAAVARALKRDYGIRLKPRKSIGKAETEESTQRVNAQNRYDYLHPNG